MTQRKNAADPVKPYLTGAPTDENTIRQSLKFFAILLLSMFMTFLVCSLTGFQSAVLRIIVNIAIEGLILTVFFTKGADYGTDAVARGEILYQHVEKGTEITASERKIPYHPLKGLVIGLAGSAVLFVVAVILAFTAEKQMTGAGVLPSWTDAYMRRSEFSMALSQYSQGSDMTFTDILRLIVRIMQMPFISMAGAENRGALLLIERLSPLLVLLPAVAYGTGYMQGPSRRRIIHKEIALNRKKRISREKRERKARAARKPSGPEQLN